MATSQEIEKNAMSDVKAVLDAAGINNVQIEGDERPEVATFVKVRCINLRGNLQGGTIPTGMYQADMAVEAHSYYHDDTDGADLFALVKDCRAALWIDTILSTLNAASTYHTYYGMSEGDSLPDTDERYRIQSMQFSLILKPEK
jgi:hypothetical protein